jgi:hypothetical protein
MNTVWIPSSPENSVALACLHYQKRGRFCLLHRKGRDNAYLNNPSAEHYRWKSGPGALRQTLKNLPLFCERKAVLVACHDDDHQEWLEQVTLDWRGKPVVTSLWEKVTKEYVRVTTLEDV